MKLEFKNQPLLRFGQFEGVWNSTIIGKLGELTGGGTPSTSIAEFWNGDIPWVSSSDLVDEDINYIRQNRFITQEAITKSATKLIPAKSILIVSRVGVGKVAVNKVELCTSQDFQSLTLRNDDPIFIAYLIQLKTKQLIELNQGTSIKGFVKSELANFKLSVPTLSEQQKIASFLSIIDDKIEYLKKKKAQLEIYKKGVMQQLFSQKLRFKDDDGNEYPEWEEKMLGEIVKFFKGTALSKSDLIADGASSCIHYGELFTIYNEVITEVRSKTNANGFKSKVGDILMPSSDVTPLGLATASTILIEDVILGGDINVLRPINIEPVFLSYLLNYEKKQIIQLVSGTTVKHIYSKDLVGIRLIVPSIIAEQTKIANFLSAIDEKITRVDQQIEYAKQFKKGLLQQMFV